MTKEDIIRLAEEGGFFVWTNEGETIEKALKRFAELIEHRLSYDDIHTCHAECQRPACKAVREAVAAEREACAKVAENYSVLVNSSTIPTIIEVGKECAAAIRSKT